MNRGDWAFAFLITLLCFGGDFKTAMAVFGIWIVIESMRAP